MTLDLIVCVEYARELSNIDFEEPPVFLLFGHYGQCNVIVWDADSEVDSKGSTLVSSNSLCIMSYI